MEGTLRLILMIRNEEAIKFASPREMKERREMLALFSLVNKVTSDAPSPELREGWNARRRGESGSRKLLINLTDLCG